MEKKKSENNLIVDVKIHYQGKVYSLSFGRIIRWLIPALLVVYRLVIHAREGAP